MILKMYLPLEARARWDAVGSACVNEKIETKEAGNPFRKLLQMSFREPSQPFRSYSSSPRIVTRRLS